MSLNNGQHVDQFGTAVQDRDSLRESAADNDRKEARDGQGRFVPGNPGGPGNPFARRVGELRRAMLAAVKEEDMADIIKALVAKAKEGHVQAAKLVLSYVLGKPQPVADPDRADVDEWELQEQTAAMSNGMVDVLKAPPASVPLRTARVLRSLVGQFMRQQMADMLTHPENHFPEMPELEIDEAEEGPSAVTDKGREERADERPSANGVFAKSGGVRKKGGGRRVEKGPSANGVFAKSGA